MAFVLQGFFFFTLESCIGAVLQLILWFSGKKGGKEYAVDGTKETCNSSGKIKVHYWLQEYIFQAFR